ncbi:MAG: sulfotransferase family 2 domain-containing protein [Acidimicrobiales bacterium]
MTGSANETIFFVHVMKTGGTTFVQHLEANFGSEERYPQAERGWERQRAYYMIDELRALSPERRRALRVYMGHFPFAASQLVGADVTMTVLRDPVDRTISFLRHSKRYQEKHRDKPLEEIYEDPWLFPLYIRNYQAKLFAMTSEDKLESHLDDIEVDEPRLRTACATLERVDVLGLSERYQDFVDEVQRRFRWRIDPVKDLRVSTEDWNVTASFRRRIAADNAADVAFYEHAQELHERRRDAG